MWNVISSVYIGIGLVYVIGVGSRRREGERRNIVGIEAGVVMIVGGLIELYGKGIGREMSVYQNEELGRIVRSIMLISGGLSMIGIGRRMRRDRHEYGIIVLLSVLGVCISASSGELMTIYLGIELSALGMYVMVSYSRRSSYSAESGIKYYIIGSTSTGLMLFGMSMIYKETGTMRLEEIGEISRAMRMDGCANAQGIERLKIGVWMVLVGLMFKVGGVPFHMWMVDVIEGANIRSARIISIVPKIGMLSVMMRIRKERIIEEVGEWIKVISIMTMVVGVVGAYKQRRVKRFMAYSSIGHIGYMLIGVGMLKEEGMSSIVAYSIVYIMSNYVIWSICERGGIRYIEEIGRRGRENKWIGGSIVIINMTMAGIPPIYGFSVKMDLMRGIVNEGEYLWTMIALLCTVVGCYNYLRWLKVIYYDRDESYGSSQREEAVKVKRSEGMSIENVLIGGIGIVLVSKTPMEIMMAL